jgi:hypothetical protein
MGYYLADCLRRYPNPGDLAHALENVLAGSGFGISKGGFEHCEPQPESDRVIGKIVDINIWDSYLAVLFEKS